MEPKVFLMWLAALVALLALVSGLELYVRREAAVRWRYSLFIVVAACMGTLFGAIFDAYTSRISPEYFSLLKGLGSIDLHRRASLLGAMAGANAGVIVGAILCYLNSRRCGHREVPDLRQLLATIPVGALGAVTLSVTLGLAASLWVEPNWTQETLASLSPAQAQRLVTAWSMHAGAYSGSLLAIWFWLKLRPFTGRALPTLRERK